MSDSKKKTSKPAWVLTFYSYKGGVGRTLALSNIARYLSEELGYRVGLIDLDTESPGLANEPLCGALDRERETEQNAIKREEIRRKINSSRGFIELFTEIYKHAKGNPWFNQLRNDLPSAEAIAQFKDLRSFCSNVKLFDYVVPLPVEGNGGVFLMPAGKRAEGRQSVELRQFRRFNSIISDRQNDNLSSVLTSAVLREFIDTLHLDFVFIDGRTGLTPFSQVYIYTIPHALVLFMGLNEQNVSGSLSVLKNASSPSKVYPAPVFLVASPVPNVNPEQLERRLTSIQEELEAIEPPEGEYSFYSLPRKIEYFLPYVDLASYQETYFIKKYPHSALSREYVRLAHSIEGLVASAEPGERPARPRNSDESKTMFAEVVEETHGKLDSLQFNIAAEDIIQNKLSDFIIRRLGLKPGAGIKKNGDDNRFAVREFKGTSGKPFTLSLHLWRATEPKAPWARLVDSTEGNTSENSASKQFDVIVLPQSFVGSLEADRIWRFDEIRREFGDQSSTFSVLSYDFLDRLYPAWRRLCGNRHGIAGLPFSANTTLLCANRQLLEELCNRFWSSKNFLNAKDTGRSLFFPSSWGLIRDLLETVNIEPGRAWHAFALAEQARGLYYEWMNVVLARGGGDLEVVEGDVVTDILLKNNPATEDGTKLFLDLASMAEPNPSRDMVAMQDLYRNNKLALCVAWSDAFRFEPPADPKAEGRLSAESPLPPQVDPNSSLDSDRFIQLGMLPRDMRYSRRPLVAGWLMVFPRHREKISEETARLKLVLTFAELFLDANAQEELLRIGFPSACLPVIENEIRLTAEHAGKSHRIEHSSKFLQNYHVFLKSQKAAMTNGHWVPAVSNSSKVINLIAKYLATAVANKRNNEATDPSLKDVFPETLINEIKELIRDPQTNGAGVN